MNARGLTMTDLLLEKFSIRDLVMRNPFRVLQLPVDASGQGIRKHQQKLRFDINQSDWKGPKPMCWPMVPPPSGAQIQEAFLQLDDPVERFLAELFWYWPDSSGTFTFGLGDWEKWPAQENGAAGPHNIALFHLFSSIQKFEGFVDGSALTFSKEDLLQWEEALARWNRVLTVDEAMWHRLRARILEIGDPRLETELIPTLRMSLIPSIEGIAINLLEEVFASRDQGKWSTILKAALAPQGRSVFSFPRQLLSIPTKELDRADQVIKSALGRILPISQGSKESIQNWFTEVQTVGSMLWLLGEEAGLSSDIAQEVHHARNDVLRKYINALRSALIDFHNETLDRVSCLAWLKVIDGWDIGGVEGGKVKADIEKISEMQSSDEIQDSLMKEIEADKAVEVDLTVNQDGYSYWTVCTCCLEDTQRKKTWTKTTKQGNYRLTRSITLPVCLACDGHKEKLGTQRAKAILTILIPAIFAAYVLGFNGAEPEAGLIVGLVVGLMCYILGRYKQWPPWSFAAEPLPAGHAHRGDPVEITAITSFSTTIRFMNPVYGRQFAKMNGAVANRSIDYCKHPRGTNIMTGRAGRQIAVGTAIGAALSGWALCGVGASQRESTSRPSGSFAQAPSAQPVEQGPVPAAPETPSATRPYSPAAPTYAPPIINASPAPDYGRSLERSRIEAMKSELSSLEIELDMKKSDLENLQSQIISSRSTAEYLSSIGNESLYNAEVDRHNSLVRRHENMRLDYNSAVANYRTKLRSANDAIDRYNHGN